MKFKWYVEYKANGKVGYMGGIEAESGNEAIKYVRDHVIGINKIVGVWHDDDDGEDLSDEAFTLRRRSDC